MTQPASFVDRKLPHHVCRLHKALYVLKQAPQAWFSELSYALFEFCSPLNQIPLFLFMHMIVISLFFWCMWMS